jgi:curli production assembly/transport component CsgG/holdfast attachment protein HfaB
MRVFLFGAIIPTLLLTTACAGVSTGGFLEGGVGGLPVLATAPITENRTPVDDAMKCYGETLLRAREELSPLSIAVGDVRDFTGRVGDQEGVMVTQGAGLMVYSSLAGIGSSIRIHERLDPRIAELELGYLDRQRLGDGQMHRASPSAEPAPWLPYMGGSILQSDYYIVGGVTELNHNLSSGGAEALIGGVGARARYAVINVAVDLRIVNTRNLVVKHAVSMQKQLIGQEVGIDVFRFFGTRLFDIKGGIQMTEPTQLAVRSVLQLATLDLLEAVSGVANEPCVRSVQPDLDRQQPRPQLSSERINWPPAPETAVSAAEINTASRNLPIEEISLGAGQAPVIAVIPSAASGEEQPSDVQSLPDIRAAVIGAATSSEVAQAQWENMRLNNEMLLSSVNADLVSVGRSEGPFLIVVEHPDNTAEQFCEAAIAASLECEVAPPQVIAARDAARQ